MDIKKSIKQMELTLKAAKHQLAANEAFKKLPVAAKRVAIAKDVIADLRAKKLLARAGTYVNLNTSEDVAVPEDLQEALVCGAVKNCTVCALGAMFVCGVKAMNKAETEQAYGMDDIDIKQYFEGIFSRDQLCLIETAFEQSIKYIGDYDVEAQYDEDKDNSPHPAVTFGRTYDLDEDRMIAIMKNIIANEGTFKPELLP